MAARRPAPLRPPRGSGLALFLAISIPLVPGSAHAVWPFDSKWGEERPLAEQAGEVLSRAIAIPTVNPPGQEAALASYFVEVAREIGLEARVVALPSEDRDQQPQQKRDGEPLRAAAWARVAGNGSARPIVLLSHLDVVPANADNWSTPPFEGRIEDGYVIGRGALDAKGVGVVQLMALALLSQRDEPLDRDVIWLATPDEEAGGLQGAGLVAREHPELLGGAEFLLTEGGNVRVGTPGTPNLWGVSVTEKSPCWLELSARGPPGHTSTPRPDDAVPRLIKALDAVRRIETRIEVLPEVQRMFGAQADLAPEAERAGYRDLRRSLADDPRFRRRFLSNPARSALVRTTISISVLQGAARTNVAPAIARAHLDARLLPGQRCADFASQVANVVADARVSVTTLLSFASKSSPIDTPLYRAIERVAARDDPGAVVVPRVTAGFTDAHYFRDLGIVAYGFVPRWLRAEDTRGIHGANERVSLENLERGSRTLAAILEELAAPRPSADSGD